MSDTAGETVNRAVGIVGLVVFVQLAIALCLPIGLVASVAAVAIAAMVVSVVANVVTADPWGVAALVVAVILVAVGLIVALMVRERTHAKRWEDALSQRHTWLDGSPSGKDWVCDTCGLQTVDAGPCSACPGTLLDRCDPDNTHAVTSSMAKRRSRVATKVALGASVVPIGALLTLTLLPAGTCPAGATFVDKRLGQMNAGETWCEDEQGDKHGLQTVTSTLGVVQREVMWEHGELHGKEVRRHGDAQPKLEQMWAHGVRHGVSTEWYPSGQMKRHGEFIDGKPVGLHEGWWGDGSKQSVNTWRDGVQAAPSILWYQHGQKRRVEPWNNGVLDGVSSEFTTSGIATMLHTYKQGKKHGEWLTANREGVVLEQGNYEHDQKVGAWLSTDKKGVRTEGGWLSGEKHGSWTTWHADKTHAQMGEYSEGKAVGTHTWWYPGGRGVQEVGTFDEQGRKQGLWRTFHDAVAALDGPTHEQLIRLYEVPVTELPAAGALASAALFVDGEQQGMERTWHANGKVHCQTTIVEGQRAGQSTCTNPLGEVVELGAYALGLREGPWMIGRMKGDFVHGERHGPWKGTFANGSPKTQGSYEAGKKTGPWKVWSTGGVLTEDISYANDVQHGPAARWDSGGSLIERGQNKEGRAHGRWVEHKGNGVRIESGWQDGYRHGAYRTYVRRTLSDTSYWDKGERVSAPPE